MPPFYIRSPLVVLPGGVRPATIFVRDGRIDRIGEYDEGPAGAPVVDSGELMVLPGLVDTHVHINEPGRTEWEGFDSATRAAAAGGVTTLVDMPLNSVPATTTAEALHVKLRAAAGQCHVDVGFWGGVVPGNAPQLEPLARSGVRGFKCFLSPSGVDEFAHVSEQDLHEALPVLSRLDLPLLVHAELPALVGDPADTTYRAWLVSRPETAEHAAIDLLIRLARRYAARVHVVHLATAGALPALRRARAEGVAITAETCPHYLSFAAEEIGQGATPFKCAPPIREAHHREGLWRGLVDGQIDLIATDHSPAPAALKQIDSGDVSRAWGGIASLQLGLSAVWTAAAARGIPVEQVIRWMSAGPAALAGLHARKGAIAPGMDADLVIWDPGAELVVDPALLHHRHRVTPYAGMRLRGRVHTTFLRGEAVYSDGKIVAPARGRPALARQGARIRRP